MTDIRSRYLITKVHFEVVTDGTRTILVQFTHERFSRGKDDKMLLFLVPDLDSTYLS